MTGKQMIDGAVLRARRDYRRPAAAAGRAARRARPHVHATRCDRCGGAGTGRIHCGRSSNMRIPGDPALNKARAYLAACLAADQRRSAAHPARLPRQARDSCCVARNVECAKARAYAGSIAEPDRVVLGRRRTRAVGNAPQRRGYRARLRCGARRDGDGSCMSLAIVARNAGHLVEASDAMKRALSVSREPADARGRSHRPRTHHGVHRLRSGSLRRGARPPAGAAGASRRSR